MVAGGRVGHDSRQGERMEISLGTWQIALKRAIANYLKTKTSFGANDPVANRTKKSDA
jgi:hypothetical protein